MGLGAVLGLVGVSSTIDMPVLAVAGISSHSSPEISILFKKNGQSSESIIIDSFASAVEMGTGDDLMTAAITSLAGRQRRFRPEGVDVDPVVGFENNLTGLSLDVVIYQ